MTIRTIHPNQPGVALGQYDVHQPSPYPYHIDEEGFVLRQDFWNGDPHALLGFQKLVHRQQLDVPVQDWWALSPESVVGMYPIFSGNGEIYTDTRPVSKVIEGEK